MEVQARLAGNIDIIGKSGHYRMQREKADGME
jgi:hypothetical protein